MQIIIIILLIVLCIYLYLKIIEIKQKFKFLKDNFQMKVLTQHIALSREVEALTLLNNNKDFTKLDEIIQRLREL